MDPREPGEIQGGDAAEAAGTTEVDEPCQVQEDNELPEEAAVMSILQDKA